MDRWLLIRAWAVLVGMVLTISTVMAQPPTVPGPREQSYPFSSPGNPAAPAINPYAFSTPMLPPTPAESLTSPQSPSTMPSLADTARSRSNRSLARGDDFAADAPLFSLSYASVGYIDAPAIMGQLRVRYDSAYGANRPNRAEFFYPRGGKSGPGWPAQERSVDAQEMNIYAEVPVTNTFSVFIDTPIRWLNPEINANAVGLSDMSAGFKYGLIADDDRLLTFQFKTFAPTGQGRRGLGTEHTSLQPGLLAAQRIGDIATLYGEFQYWLPIGGTDFAGDVLRYGVGVAFGQPSATGFWVTPVIETVGWTVLDGKQSTFISPARANIEDAAGASILNLKGGLRFGSGSFWDGYIGYGRALTGEVWYKDVIRIELRTRF